MNNRDVKNYMENYIWESINIFNKQKIWIRSLINPIDFFFQYKFNNLQKINEMNEIKISKLTKLKYT